jgi:PTS system mannose-specific IIA component
VACGCKKDEIEQFMIGILIVTHCQLGNSLIEAATFIIGHEPEALGSVSIDLNENAEKLREKISQGIKSVDTNNGVLILTDMFGGTPSNLSYSFLEEGRIEVLSGVNLPILIKSINSRKNANLVELAASLEAYGKKSISLASAILKGNKRS